MEVVVKLGQRLSSSREEQYIHDAPQALVYHWLLLLLNPSFHIFCTLSLLPHTYKTLFSTLFPTQHFHAVSWVDHRYLHLYNALLLPSHAYR